jgi:hypothetical protein
MEVKLNRFLNQIWPRGQQFANLTDWKALMKIFFFFFSTRVLLRAFTLSHSTSPIFVKVFLR